MLNVNSKKSQEYSIKNIISNTCIVNSNKKKTQQVFYSREKINFTCQH